MMLVEATPSLKSHDVYQKAQDKSTILFVWLLRARSAQRGQSAVTVIYNFGIL